LLSIGQRVEPPRLLREQVTDLELPVGARVLGGYQDATDLAVAAFPRHCQTEFPSLWDVLYFHILLTFLLLLCLL
jgi:hypothetical protein